MMREVVTVATVMDLWICFLYCCWYSSLEVLNLAVLESVLVDTGYSQLLVLPVPVYWIVGIAADRWQQSDRSMYYVSRDENENKDERVVSSASVTPLHWQLNWSSVILSFHRTQKGIRFTHGICTEVRLPAIHS